MLLLIASPALALAGQVETIPSQKNLTLPPASPRPFVNQNQERAKELPPIAPGSQSSTRELPLPEVFRGCWRGTVAEVDSIVPIDPEAGGTIWLTKVYTLCYKQTGANGKWMLTFAENRVADARVARDQRQSIKVKSVSGPDRAELTAYLHFRAPVVNAFGGRTGLTNTLDELAHLHCLVDPNHQVMNVRAAVFVEENDRPSVNITWHTRFLRIPATAAN